MVAIALRKIALLGLLFRLTPYDRSTAQGRSNERYRRVAVTSCTSATEAGPAILALVMLFAVGLPLSSVQQVQMGFHEGYINDLYQIAGNFLALCGILMSTWLQLGLPWLIIFFAGPLLAASLANFIAQFYVKRPWLKPQFKLVTPKTAKEMLSNGGVFLLLSAEK